MSRLDYFLKITNQSKENSERELFLTLNDVQNLCILGLTFPEELFENTFATNDKPSLFDQKFCELQAKNLFRRIGADFEGMISEESLRLALFDQA